MELVAESPVVRWFLQIGWDRVLTVQSPSDIYFNYLPLLSTVVSTVSVGFICPRMVSAFHRNVQLFVGIVCSYLFLRYVWFQSFIHYRRLCNEQLDIDVDFCRRFLEPGLASVVAVVLTIVACRGKSVTEIADAKESSTGIPNVDSKGEGTGQNSNNSASSGDNRFRNASTSDGGISNPASAIEPEENEDELRPFGQLFYCQRCGQVVYEAIGDPFPPPLAPLTRPGIPKALVMKPDDGSAPSPRHLRCPNCVELKMNAAGLRGLRTTKISFAVGQHNLRETIPKSIIKRGP